MSLIIGRVDNSKVYILGDTALTFTDLRKANPFIEGCLKQYIITDTLAIAFAGDSGAFEGCLPAIFSASNASSIIDIAVTAQEKGGDFELLIGEVGYENIRTIKNGLLAESKATYIGNKVGFESFQRNFHTKEDENSEIVELNRATIQFLQIPEPTTADEPYPRLYEALKKTILEKNIPSVGGIIIPLCSHNGKFCYLSYADITSDLININDIKNIPIPIEFGTREKGGYSVEFCNDISYGGQGKNIGYYFLQGGFGIVFPFNQTGIRKPQIIYAENPAYWILETKKLLGYGIGFGYLTGDHCGIAGEKLLQEGKYQDAVFCYELKKNDVSLASNLALYDRYISGYATAMFNCDDKQRKTAIIMLEEFIKKYPYSPRCKEQLNRMLGRATN